MADISLPWDKGEIALNLPENWTAQQVASPNLPEAPQDWRERLAIACARSDTGASLAELAAEAARRNHRVAVIVEDITRHSPLAEIMDVLMREIRHAGVKDEQVEIIFAVGMHPPMSPEQASEKLGESCTGVNRTSNPWQDPSSYKHLGRISKTEIWVYRGVAEAQLRIVVSSVSPHLQAGFSGGYKMIFPGCANLKTIRALHKLGVGSTPRQLTGTAHGRNPMRSTIDAAGELLDRNGGRTFTVQYLLDRHDLPAVIATGDATPTQRMLAKQCALGCGVVMDAPADVLITNAYPRNIDLWQSLKSIINTIWAVRPNGAIICTSPCPLGTNNMDIPRWPISAMWTRRFIRLLGHEALFNVLTRLVPSLGGEAEFFVRMALQTIHRNPVFLASPRLAKEQLSLPAMSILDRPEQAVEAADQYLGPGQQRVVVFPNGGITYPVIMSQKTEKE